MTVPTSPRTLPDGVTLRQECSCGWACEYPQGFDPGRVRSDMRNHLASHGFRGRPVQVERVDDGESPARRVQVERVERDSGVSS